MYPDGEADRETTMALTMGTGPFGKEPAVTFNFEPDPPQDHALYLEPSPRRVRGVYSPFAQQVGSGAQR
jgi:hypothetical protein